MNFQQKISAFVLKILNEEDISEIGMTGLNEGLLGDHLNILAGLSKTENPFQVREYLDKTLSELNLTYPTITQAKHNLTEYYCDKIISMDIDPYDGFNKIIEIIGDGEIAEDQFDLKEAYSEYLIIWETESDGLEFYDKRKYSKSKFIELSKQGLIQILIERQKRKTPHNNGEHS